VPSGLNRDEFNSGNGREPGSQNILAQILRCGRVFLPTSITRARHNRAASYQTRLRREKWLRHGRYQGPCNTGLPARRRATGQQK